MRHAPRREGRKARADVGGKRGLRLGRLWGQPCATLHVCEDLHMYTAANTRSIFLFRKRAPTGD